MNNFPTASNEVTITNDGTNPIPVTGIVSTSVCPADKVVHWYHMRYGMSNAVEFIHPENPTISPSTSRIHIPVSSDDVLFDIDSDVVDRLTELGYTARNIDTGIVVPIDGTLIGTAALESITTGCSETGT